MPTVPKASRTVRQLIAASIASFEANWMYPYTNAPPIGNLYVSPILSGYLWQFMAYNPYNLSPGIKSCLFGSCVFLHLPVPVAWLWRGFPLEFCSPGWLVAADTGLAGPRSF